MARPSRKPHELVPFRKRNSAVVTYRGRKFHLGPWDLDKDEPSEQAVARLAELVSLWRADPLATAGKSSAGGPLLAELWADWRESPEGAAVKGETVRRLERFLFGSQTEPGPWRYAHANEFRGEALRSFQRALCDAKLSRDTVTKAVRAVRKLFAWGLVGRQVQFDQFRELELVGPPARGQVKEAVRRQGVPWATVEKTLPHLSPPLAAAVRLLWHTGARPSEVLGLRAGDIVRGGELRAASGVLLDLTALGVWAAVKDEHKTEDSGYDRVIFFGPKAQAVLGPLLEGREPRDVLLRPADGRAWDLERKKASRKPGGYGSYKPTRGEKAKRKPGEMYGYQALGTAVERACERAGVPHFTPYQVRHAVARLVQQQHGRDAARVFLGHQVGGVSENYCGADLAAAAKVAAAWG